MITIERKFLGTSALNRLLRAGFGKRDDQGNLVTNAVEIGETDDSELKGRFGVGEKTIEKLRKAVLEIEENQ